MPYRCCEPGGRTFRRAGSPGTLGLDFSRCALSLMYDPMAKGGLWDSREFVPDARSAVDGSLLGWRSLPHWGRESADGQWKKSSGSMKRDTGRSIPNNAWQTSRCVGGAGKMVD